MIKLLGVTGMLGEFFLVVYVLARMVKDVIK